MSQYGATGQSFTQIADNLTSGSSASVWWAGGDGTLVVAGTFGGTTAGLQLSLDGTTFVPLSGATATAAGAVNFSLPPCHIRLTLTGGSGIDLDSWVGKRVMWTKP